MTQINITKFESSKLTNKFNDASNISHPNPTTFFSTAEGVGKSFLEARFDDEQEINNLAISFPRGRDRKTYFSVLYIDSKDNYKKIEPSPFFASSGESQNTQQFNFKKVKAKGVRLTFLGNADNELFNQKGNAPHGRISAISSQTSESIVDVGPGKQIFSIRKLSISCLEDVVVSEEEEDSDKKDECESCQFCGNAEKSSLKGGVCQVCKNTCHVDSNKVPFSYVGLTPSSSSTTGQRDVNDDRGIKSVRARAHDSNSGFNNAGPSGSFAYDPMITAMGHRDLPNRDNYTNLSTHTNLKTPQERPQIIFQMPEIRRTFIPSATGERYDQQDNTRNVISSVTPQIHIPDAEETKAIVANRKRTDELRAARPNGDININTRDLSKELELLGDEKEEEKPSNKKQGVATGSKSTSNNNSRNDNNNIIVSPTPIKDLDSKKDDSKVKIVKEKEVNEEKLDPDIAKTFDDFLKDGSSDVASNTGEILPENHDTINNFNEFPELDSALANNNDNTNRDKNPLEAPGKASDSDTEKKKFKTK